MEVLKSYKDLCWILNEPPMTGNSKIKQLKVWECYFKFEKIKTKYLIIEIYDSPLVVKSKSDFVNLLEIALERIIKQKETNIFSFNDLFKELRLVNYINYNEGKYDIQVCAMNIGIDMPNQLFEDTWHEELEYNLYRFMRISSKLIKQKMVNAFKSMENRGTYKVEVVYKFGKVSKVKNVRNKIRECTIEEINTIEKVKLDKLNDEFKGDHKYLFTSTKKIRDKFRNEINDLTAKQHGYDYQFKCYKFIKLKNISSSVAFKTTMNTCVISMLIGNSELGKMVITGVELNTLFIGYLIKK